MILDKLSNFQIVLNKHEMQSNALGRVYIKQYYAHPLSIFFRETNLSNDYRN